MKSGISMIAAMDRNRLIGGNNKLLWHLPGDLKRFKEITSGHPVIMGRKTFESIGRILPLRTNIIISRDRNYSVNGAVVVHSLEEAMAKGVECEGGDELFIIGGGQIYAAGIKYAGRLYLTLVDGVYTGDTYFPEYHQFNKVISEKRVSEGGYTYLMQVLEK